MSRKKAFIFYDGSNVYHALKHLGFADLLGFDFSAFNRLMVGKAGYQAHYYVGAIRQERGNRKSKKLYANQLKLFAQLVKHNFHIYKGYMLKSDGVYHEKGVDVQIAIDLVVGAYEGLYQKVFLLSSDTDLIPAITKVQNLGKIVCYVGFESRVSKAMLYNCREHRLYRKAELLPFLS